MAKKKVNEEEIVETEPAVINEADIVSEEEVSKEETIEVEAPEVIIENNSEEETENLTENLTENADNEEVETSTGDIKTDELSAEAPETEYKLSVQVNFTDKYDNSIHYKAGDVIENLSKERYDELKNDPRKLVCDVY